MLYGHADQTRCGRPTSALVASGTATLEAALCALPARDLLSRQCADRAHRRAQAAAALGRACPTCSPGASSCRSSCRTDATAANLAQAALNLFDDTRDAAPPRGAVRRRMRRGHWPPTRATPGGRAVRDGAARWRASHADRRRRRSGPGAAGRAGGRRGRDPRPGAARSRGLRDSKLLDGAGARATRRRDPRAAVAWAVARARRREKSTRSTSCRRRCSRCGARSSAWRTTPAEALDRRQLHCPTLDVPDAGDRRRRSRLIAAISAASILAKTARDALLVELDSQLSGVRLRAAQGLRTPEHLAALRAHGPVPGRTGATSRRSLQCRVAVLTPSTGRAADDVWRSRRSRRRAARTMPMHACGAVAPNATRSEQMIHCVLHDPRGFGRRRRRRRRQGRPDADRAHPRRGPDHHAAVHPGHPARPQGGAEGHGRRRDTVIKYGVDIGKVVAPIRAGRARPRPQHQDQAVVSLNMQEQHFWGYRRENGRVGVRNHVIILPVDDLSNAGVRGRRATTSRARWRSRIPTGGCSSARTSTCISAR